MRPVLVVGLLVTATTPLPAQGSAPYAPQLRATVLVSHSVPVAPDTAPVVSRAVRPSHLERSVAGGATAGAIFAFFLTGVAVLANSVPTEEAIGYLAPRVAVGAGIGALVGLAGAALPPPP